VGAQGLPELTEGLKRQLVSLYGGGAGGGLPTCDPAD